MALLNIHDSTETWVRNGGGVWLAVGVAVLLAMLLVVCIREFLR